MIETGNDGILYGQRMLISILRDISEQKPMDEQLEYIARHDYLTNIPNRFYLEEFISGINTNMQENENVFLIMDLDNFKIINSSYGYAVGDKLLMETADSLKRKLRDSDFIARMGGDEFAIVLSNTSLKGAQTVAKKLLETIEKEGFHVEEDTKISITASIGITMINKAMDLRQLFSYADAALQAAKEEGKNRAVVLQDRRDKDTVINNSRILTLIQNSLLQDRFQIYLQPVHKASDGPIHYEVLVRMLDEDSNVLLPSSFIPIAERYGLMPSIDKWVINNTIKFLSKEKELNVFINLCGISLSDDALLQWIESTLKHGDVDPSKIGFEITETTAIRDLEKAEMWIHKLRALGCQFALDDFGVGFSSFSYLNLLPVDYLKIDGTFIRDLDTDPTKLALVKAMNMVAHTLGKKTIAEYVENSVIWSMLQELGVDYGQGYYLGKPTPFEYLHVNNAV